MRAVGFAVMAGLLSVVSGCMTAEQQRAADEGKCRGFGFRARTDAFAECLQRIDLARSAARRYDSDFDRWDGPIVVYRSMAMPVEAK
jgi:Flp pilus assembly protein TadD